MFLVVGLGNPGSRYQDTRHNIGFELLERMGRSVGGVWHAKFDGLMARWDVASRPVLFLKPGTFMNRSGQSVGPAARYFRVDPEHVLVAHDDVDLPLGTLRLKFGGGEAGHRGLKSISAVLGTPDYGRLRMGVGRPPSDFTGPLADFVLEAFLPSEAEQVEATLGAAADAVRGVIENGFPMTMNRVNRRDTA